MTWLTPHRRGLIYRAVLAIGVIATTVGIATEGQAAHASAIANAALAFAALVMASIQARRADWTAIYGVSAGLIAAVSAAGILSVDVAARVDGTVEQLLMLAPILLAIVRTDPTTTTGEPAEEYEARHA